MSTETLNYYDIKLPAGIRSRTIANGNGLNVHMLEAGFTSGERPCILLLHGFPELAYSWRKIMVPLAELGFHVVAPDQRGYGRTTGWDGRYDADLTPYQHPNLVTDALGLIRALGHDSVAAVIGHDFGSPVAAWCALIRPDVFHSVVLMSAPFAGPPALAPNAATVPDAQIPTDIHADLAQLERPRKHYQHYYSERRADADMRHCTQGLKQFLRAYYHVKSASWSHNKPHPLPGWNADALAELPTYYVMDSGITMAETVAPHMPASAEISACHWLTDEELDLYVAEFSRTGFQGGLQWYRVATNPSYFERLKLYSGKPINVPSMFIAGARDWGVYQKPGDFQKMQDSACTDLRSVHLLEDAGHWVQQEQADAVAACLERFLDAL